MISRGSESLIMMVTGSPVTGSGWTDRLRAWLLVTRSSRSNQLPTIEMSSGAATSAGTW